MKAKEDEGQRMVFSNRHILFAILAFPMYYVSMGKLLDLSEAFSTTCQMKTPSDLNQISSLGRRKIARKVGIVVTKVSRYSIYQLSSLQNYGVFDHLNLRNCM